MTAPTEKRFEEYIETSLLSQGYSTIHYSEYDKQLCLIPDEVMTFLKESQPDPYKNLFPRKSKSTTMRVLKHISDEIEKHGLVEVLRKGVKVDGENLNLIYFQPNSGLNKDHEQLFKKNRFTLVRQLRYSQNNENALDLVLFINGLPVVTMELKSTLNNQTYKDAEKQYKTTRDLRDILFRFMRCIVHFCVDDDYVSMTTKLSGESTFFLPFNKGIENPNNLFGYKTSYLWEEVLTPESICDIIENFVHVAKETKTKWDNTKKRAVDTKSIVLVFPRYHQLEVIRKLKETIREEGAGHNYLIQHTTGSGKSYSIGWLAHLLTSLFQSKVDTTRMFDCVIVVTDRVVLDRQLQATIKQLEQTRGVVAGVEAGSKQLKQFLQSGKDIIITTIQKFPYISSEIAGMKNKKFAVIIDEVHSSQTGETAKHLKKALSSTGEIDEVENVEDKLLKEIESRGKQPHISYFGFTGTPKNKTLEIFGRRKEGGKFEAFHYYTMRQSIHEGFTLDVLQNYTTAKRYFKVVKKDAEDKEVPKEKAESAVLELSTHTLKQ
jgi:type I restriction enzyme R subunit